MGINLRAAVWAGIAAGVVSTLAQALVWILVSRHFPGTLLRDARLTAAILLGPSVLPPPATFDVKVMVLAGLIHFALSIAYGLLIALFLTLSKHRHILAIGAAFGMALYGINLYGFTALWPWFSQVRGANTLAAHIVFGLTAAAVYGTLARSRSSRPAA